MSLTLWSNWAGSVRCGPAAVVRPTTVERVVAVVQKAAAEGQTIRVVGSGHSFTPLAATDGVMLSLERATGIVSMNTERREVTVLGGTRLRNLGRSLVAEGLAMENLGDIDAQSLAGAVSTGTHGTGLSLGTLSTQLTSVTLVTATGDVVDCSADCEPGVFRAAGVSLGALGVLWRMRLRLLPVYRLRYTRKSMDLEECLARLLELTAHRHFELYWFPHTERVDVKAMDPTEEPASNELGRLVNDLLFENGAFWLLSEACRWVPPLCAPASRLCARLVAQGTRVGPSHRIFATPRLVRFNEMEYAVPSEHGADCLREIRQYVVGKRVRVHFPVELRFARGDDIWLSPAYCRDTAYVAVHQYRGMPHEEYFAGVEAIFKNHGGRPHWGKLHTRTAADLAALSPMWESFHDVRRRLDPRGIFLNEYLRTLFGA